MLVSRKLVTKWSPEQISGWLRRTFDDAAMNVSHETIYKTIFIQSRSALKQELGKHLRTRRQMRRIKKASRIGQSRGNIVDAVSIRDRPAQVENRAIPGHWEGDLMAGGRNSHIATLVERKSRFTMIVKLMGKDAPSVSNALKSSIRKIPVQVRKTLTWDRGKEMAFHKAIAMATDIEVYFCDPRSPWQRGTNENTNGLLRQYFPKGMPLGEISQPQLNRVAQKLNARPRKTLNFRTPAEVYDQVLR